MVWMGAESGSQRILDAMEKGVRVEQIRDAQRILRQPGIAVGLFLQFGYPGETWDDIEATLALVRELDPDDSASRSRIRCRARTFMSAYGKSSAEAELGRFGRPGDDVSGDVRARLLSRAPRRRAPRVPRPAHEARRVKGALDLAAITAPRFYLRAALPFTASSRNNRRAIACPARLAPMLTRGGAPARPSEQDT